MPATLFNPRSFGAQWQPPLWALEVSGASHGPARALILDTDIALCRQVAVALRTLGVQTDLCTDAAQALEHARHAQYAVAIVDVSVADGLNVSRRLSRGESGRPVPVVAFTRGGSFLERLRARRHGCRAYVCKPAPLERFVRTVWRTCRGAASAHDTRSCVGAPHGAA